LARGARRSRVGRGGAAGAPAGTVPGAPGVSRRALSCALGALLLGAACAKPVVRAPLPPTEGYVYPGAKPGDAAPDEISKLEESWRALKAGNVRSAEKGFRGVLAKRPGLPAGEAGLGQLSCTQ